MTVKERNTETTRPDRSPADLLARWHADHRNFARLLDLVEQQVDGFHADKSPDYELMRLIVYYLRHYPDRFHHPREDVYYRHHLAAEERQVIPRAVELLTPADWAAVAAIPTEPDPLFGVDFDARYSELRGQVAREAKEVG